MKHLQPLRSRLNAPSEAFWIHPRYPAESPGNELSPVRQTAAAASAGRAAIGGARGLMRSRCFPPRTATGANQIKRDEERRPPLKNEPEIMRM